jgi:voltage-gated potassium channel
VDFIVSLLVRFAYFVEHSKKYRRSKEFCRTLLEHPTSKLKFYFDLFMVILVVLSVLFLLYEVKNPDLHPFMDFFINASLVVFITEYLLRLWIYSDNHKLFLERYEYALNNHASFSLFKTLHTIVSKKIEYIISPLAIIDLLAILPSYRPLRFLRIFLLFRIFKLFRYARSMKTFTTIISEKKFELFTLAIFAGFVIFTGSSAIYIFETNVNPKINTLFDAIYWSIVTMGTVGYGDIVPVTKEGMVISMILIIFGVAILAFLTSIIVSSFQTKLQELKSSRTLADIERLKSYILVCGYGRVGEVVAKMLHDDGYAVVIIDIDAEKIKLANQRGMIGILGDASKSKLLGQLGVGKRASKVICVTNSDEMNVFITMTARSLSKEIDIIARVVKSYHKKKYMLAGANFALSADETIGLMGSQYIDQPISYAALDDMLTETTGVLFESLKIYEKSIYINKTIATLELREKRLLLFGVVREEVEPTALLTYAIDDKIFYFNPPGDFVIQKDDTLIIMGKRHHINLLKKHSDKRAPK